MAQPQSEQRSGHGCSHLYHLHSRVTLKNNHNSLKMYKKVGIYLHMSIFCCTFAFAFKNPLLHSFAPTRHIAKTR